MSLKKFLKEIELDRSPATRRYAPCNKNLLEQKVLERFVVDINEVINSFSAIPEDLREEMLNECYWWYLFYLRACSLRGRTSSLKSDLRNVYKRYRKDLIGFDKLMQKVWDVFKTLPSDE